THLPLQSVPTRRSSDLAQFFVIAIARHINASLRAGFDDARPLRKLMPHAVNLDVEHRSAIGRFVRHLLIRKAGTQEIHLRKSARSEEHTSELQSPDHLV